MVVSEITNKELADYLRLEYTDLTDQEKIDLNTLLGVGKAYILSYTGLTDTEVDTHEDFIIVVYILVQDMYDNRTLYVEKNNLNKVVDTILGMHSVNLL